MYNWLREKADEYYIECRDGIDNIEQWSKRDSLVGFLEWLEATSASPWRSVEDGLPEDDKGLSDKKRQQYFIRGTDDYYSTSFFSLGMWALLHITHWQPITPLPKEGE